MFNKWALRACILFGVLIATFFLLRNTALQYVFGKVQKRLFTEYKIQLNAELLRFGGIDKIIAQRVSVQPIKADTLLTIEQFICNLSVFDLLTGKIGFDYIQADTINICIYNTQERNNVTFFNPPGRIKRSNSKKAENNYLRTAQLIQRNLLVLFNTEFNLKEITFRYEDSILSEHIRMPTISYDLKTLTGKLVSDKVRDTLAFIGAVKEKNKSYLFSVSSPTGNKAYLPFSDSALGIKYSFTSLTATLDFENSRNEAVIKTGLAASNFRVNHWRLSTEDVIVHNAAIKAVLHFKEHAIELDSTSELILNNTPLRLYANYQERPEKIFTCLVQMPEIVADTFFHSLPQGMFHTLNGISCTGTLKYDLRFRIPLEQPDSLFFESSLTRKNLSIRHFGNENFSRINQPFTYEAYDKDRFIRYIEISPSNPMFTPIGRISPFLIKSVLQSEDPSFMQHRGFLQESFRESIIKNYKEKRFARGGSTISMQLVKNVFLSRNKTISRKVEEALIVYLIENLGLVSKERMLEIYLNVIEWGPNVYGIGEASRFYFSKKPSELTLQESIFLAGIIPAPKYFKYQFDKQGQLKSYLSGYFRILTERMSYKGWIDATDTTGLRPDVKLKGPALRFILPEDTFSEPLLPEE
jgi:hypothetical protein